MPNIEIKAHCPDITKARKLSERIKTKYVGCDHQIDTYFKTPNGRFKLRESTLSGAYLIPYIRPDEHGPKKSDYAQIPVTDADHVKSLFGALLGIERIVDKNRDIFLIDNVRVHLDIVKDLGSFLEFEAVYSDDTDNARQREQRKVEELMKVYEINASDLIQGSYREL